MRPRGYVDGRVHGLRVRSDVARATAWSDPDRHEGGAVRPRQQENILRDYGKAEVDGLLPHDVAAVAVARCFGATTIERNPELVAHWVARWRKPPARSVYNEVRSWLGKADNRPELANIDVPALILHGEEDSIFPVSVAEEIEAGIPRARLVMIALAGHTANLEQPEASNAAILDFLGSTFGGHRERRQPLRVG